MNKKVGLSTKALIAIAGGDIKISLERARLIMENPGKFTEEEIAHELASRFGVTPADIKKSLERSFQRPITPPTKRGHFVRRNGPILMIESDVMILS